MSQKSRYGEWVLLPEFTDDASNPPQNTRPAPIQNGPETMSRLVARIARELGLKGVNLDPILNQLVVDMGAELEERVRKVLLKMIEDDRKASEDSSAA